MKHLTEEELVDYYYAEPASSVSVTARHLQQCDTCAHAYTSLQQDLDSVKSIEVPTRDAQYGEHVWNSIRHSLPVYEKQKRSWLNLAKPWRPLSLASACALLVAIAFFAGRQWEHHQTPPLVARGTQPARPIILVVMGDHLDRSERLLTQLNHADAASISPVRAEANDLLSANRLYRESAAQANDPELTAALDRLERVLVELVNQPDDASPARLASLQKEMNTDGLLFEVRVLRSRVPDQPQSQPVRTKGVSI